MSLTVFNGSPRGKSSNSQVICDWFCQAYGPDTERHYLHLAKHIPDNVQRFLEAQSILMVFPLYVDGMPGQVKAFIEALVPYKSSIANKRITFIIHSGFSEGIQSRALEAYLKRFSAIFSLNNQGIIIIPGSEGIRLMPPAMTKKKQEAITALGHAFLNQQSYTGAMLKAVNPHETMTTTAKVFFKLGSKLGLTNLYWNSNLKKNKAYDRRFDAPYADQPVPITCPGHVQNYE